VQTHLLSREADFFSNPFKEEYRVPVCVILAPAGLSPDAKKQMMAEVTSAIEEGYSNFVTEVYLRELSAQDLMLAGVVANEDPAFNSRFKTMAT
jgi:hypothetical protein